MPALSPREVEKTGKKQKAGIGFCAREAPGILVLSFTGEVRYFNRAAGRRLNLLPAGDFCGPAKASFLPTVLLEWCEELKQREGGEWDRGRTFPSCVFLRRGERILFRAFPLRDQEGRKIGSMLVLIEGVTEAPQITFHVERSAVTGKAGRRIGRGGEKI